MGVVMAKFLKIQNYYINVEHISYIEISGSGENKNAAIFVGDRDTSIAFRAANSEQHKLTSQEIETLENYLIKNAISY
jgi:hypothetical protein